MLVVAVGIGVVESTMARLRLTHVPVLLMAACVLSAFGIILLMR
jgi:formate hydrogenlyase subunit 4